MFNFKNPQKNPLFNYYAPLNSRFKGIISIPHSGEDIPEEFRAFLTENTKLYKEDVDYKVNDLVDIEKLQNAGIGVLVAHVHRICVDLNRSENQCVLFWKNNTKGKQLVIRDPSEDQIEMFIQSYHRPYFEVLKSILKELESQHSDPVSMIDLHSMPSRPTEYHLKQNPHQKSHREDFCLSDRKGKTCSKEFIEFFKNSLETHSYSVALNDPYVGGYVTEYVDQFKTNNIQIEINRSIYMDEDLKILLPEKVQSLRPKLTQTLVDGLDLFATNKP
jgi:N-formylglutamate amidohydrolase